MTLQKSWIGNTITARGEYRLSIPDRQKRSDHAPFNDIGIPYIYFEANNWENGSPIETEKHGLIMHTDKDDLDFIENEYGERAKNTLTDYSTLLYSLLQENDWEQEYK